MDERIQECYTTNTYPRTVLGGTGNILVNEMKDSSHLINDANALQARLSEDGYILLREFIPPEEVFEAREAILQCCAQENLLDDQYNIMLAVCKDVQKSAGLLKRMDIAYQLAVLKVLEHQNMYKLLEELLGGEVVTFAYKWLRAVHQHKFTGIHMDRVYLGGATNDLYSIWIPLGDIPTYQGTLMVIPQSHTSEKYKSVREEYGINAVGPDGVSSGWYSDNAEEFNKEFNNEVDWVSTDFKAGDVCIIGLDIIHMSTANLTNRYRLSCDTRWQPANHPVYNNSPVRTKEEAGKLPDFD
eukprot:TRINITY_DN2174_c0_g1_i1.p1 TRINITY_DN2174_c0_g1~~TRINITY_DN2174_c0_g1_i1.p1  ORF type:complete len:299 (+),score=67.89 TRINITY_DN2174_c0_g1_i1:934-1830(+)